MVLFETRRCAGFGTGYGRFYFYIKITAETLKRE
jgi:hypothetical protein